MARDRNILRLDFIGKGNVDDRDTLIFERRLPHEGAKDPLWPDRVPVVHMDAEYKLPVLCESYSDDDKKNLLGRYQTTEIKLNPNLPDSVFSKEGLGFN
jgi:hypothetical protein